MRRSKANLFADNVLRRSASSRDQVRMSSQSGTNARISKDPLFSPSEKQCRNALAHLSDESSTGPDLVPARILKSCAEQLAKPLQILLLRLLETACWPESWREHKKRAVFSASN